MVIGYLRPSLMTMDLSVIARRRTPFSSVWNSLRVSAGRMLGRCSTPVFSTTAPCASRIS
jgi:hypothetical protein